MNVRRFSGAGATRTPHMNKGYKHDGGSRVRVFRVPAWLAQANDLGVADCGRSAATAAPCEGLGRSRPGPERSDGPPGWSVGVLGRCPIHYYIYIAANFGSFIWIVSKLTLTLWR